MYKNRNNANDRRNQKITMGGSSVNNYRDFPQSTVKLPSKRCLQICIQLSRTTLTICRAGSNTARTNDDRSFSAHDKFPSSDRRLRTKKNPPETYSVR